MKDKKSFFLRKARSCGCLSRFATPSWRWALVLLLVAACAPKALPPPPPPYLYPSRVITQDGLAFMVHRLRFPGTRQEITIRDGGAKQWLPLNLLELVNFSGPVRENYRHAEIVLISGEKMKGEVFVGTLVEGNTDLGYWNMPFSRIERLQLGKD